MQTEGLNQMPASERLAQHGFVEIAGAFSDEEVRRVEAMLDPLFNESGSSGVVDLRAGEVREICRAVQRVRDLRSSRVFLHCRELASEWLGRRACYAFDHAIYKHPGRSSEIHWHQDQAYQRLDLQLQSIHFWIPLQAMTHELGALEFVVGSQRFGVLKHHEVAGARTLAVDILDGWQLHRSDATLGGLSAHLPRTIHRSTENLSGSVRKAWIIHFSPHGKLDMLRLSNLWGHCQRLREDLKVLHRRQGKSVG